MRIKLLLVFISLLALSLSAQETGQDLFWKNLSQYCGKSFEGKITSEGKNEGFDGERLVMHVKTCSEDQLKISFNVGNDKSRTWILTKDKDGILLKHDHRDKDGNPEGLTMYGGKTTNFGNENMQAFPVDKETCTLISRACFNVWWITVDDKSFTYDLRIVNSERRFTVAFDLMNEVNIISKVGVKYSGTGFALSSNGYIATNHHLTKGASRLKVRGVKGDFSISFDAKVVIEDKNNDLSIIKINDPDFISLGAIPYQLNTSFIEVGNPVYSLGYPLRATMGDEVKLTNGIISSQSGFQGDITTYQITVPIQPGNSGGPLFDTNGNVIGIVNSKHIGAENASYAIKSNYLISLIQAINTPFYISKTNDLIEKSLSEQVQYLKDFVYIIEIN